jgi:hypothetical protein
MWPKSSDPAAKPAIENSGTATIAAQHFVVFILPLGISGAIGGSVEILPPSKPQIKIASNGTGGSVQCRSRRAFADYPPFRML